MSNFFKDRAKEKSTWAIGIPALIIGLGTLFKADYIEPIANVVRNSADALASGDYVAGGTAIGMGLLGIFMKSSQK